MATLSIHDRARLIASNGYPITPSQLRTLYAKKNDTIQACQVPKKVEKGYKIIRHWKRLGLLLGPQGENSSSPLKPRGDSTHRWINLSLKDSTKKSLDGKVQERHPPQDVALRALPGSSGSSQHNERLRAPHSPPKVHQVSRRDTISHRAP